MLRRPNRIAVTVCRLLRVEGVRIYVSELDAVAGTPVIDIKPVLADFLPRGEIRQPDWSREILADYWKRKSDH